MLNSDELIGVAPNPNEAAKSLLISDLGVAAIIGFSRATVWRRVADGTLPRPIKIGHLTRWSRAEIEAVIEAALAARDEAAK